MTTTTQRLGGPVAITVCALVMLALSLFQPAEVRAQWTTPDASQNINNTNTGNVGIGTTVPAYKLDLSNSVDKGQIRFGMGASDTGGYLYSGGPSHAALSGGASWNGGWIARSLSASLFEANNGQLMFYANSGTSTGSPFTPTERMRISSSGSVGIGTTLPNALLELASPTQLLSRIRLSGQEYYQAGNTSTSGIDIRLGANRTGERQLWFADSANAINATTAQIRMRFQGSYTTLDSISTDGTATLPLAINATGGNVGIGTTAPLTKLHVGGGTRVDGTSGRLYLGTGAVQNFRGLEIIEENATTFSIRHHDPNVAWRNIVLNPHGGNVGIGNLATNPAYKLDVSGSMNASAGLCLAGDCKTAWSQVGGSQWTTAGSNIHFATGNVGIGTTSPAELVHLRKDQNASTQLLVENGTAGVSANADLQVKNNLGHIAQFGLYSSTTTTAGAIASGNAYTYTTSPAMVIMANTPSGVIKFATGGLNERMRIDASGNVGIGTTTPSDPLQVDSAGWGLRIRYTGDGQYLRLSANQISSFTSADVGRDLYLNPAGGNVGIGTATPISGNKLDVNGNTNVTGNLNVTGTVTGGTIHAKYQDVAEWVESSQRLSAGTVVVLDQTKSNQVVASTEAYDTRVAGVISAQPGITLGVSGEAKVLVATTGRVRIKVDATKAAIQVGDLLVTGDKEGYAMKSLPVNIGGVQLHRPGTLVGKALEPLAKGTGEILVLLSLQ